MRKQSPKNVLMKDGKIKRIPGDVAEELIASGQAKQYISNTVYRALTYGIEVPNPSTRDEKGVLRSKIRDARERQHKRSKKKEEQEQRKAEKEAEQELHESSDD